MHHSVVSSFFPTLKKAISMTEKEFYQLLDRYLQRTCTEDEKISVEKFIQNNSEKPSEIASWEQERKSEAARRLKGQIMAEIRTPARSIHFDRYKWIGIAASVLLIGVPGYLFSGKQQEPAELQLVTKTTLFGQKLTFQLSDGSTVRLNAGSSLSFMEQFGEQREVYLSGEAFFEVTKNAAKPFIVNSGVLHTEVLGTSFNITAFQEIDEIKVTVATGQVRVVSNSPFEPGRRFEGCDGCGQEGDVLSETLTPGQQATYNKTSHELSLREVDIEKYLAWKDGILYLSEADYKQVFEQLTRWYGVEFEFVNVPTVEWDYSGEFKDMSLELVLSTIGYSKGFDFQVQENVVTLKFEN